MKLNELRLVVSDRCPLATRAYPVVFLHVPGNRLTWRGVGQTVPPHAEFWGCGFVVMLEGGETFVQMVPFHMMSWDVNWMESWTDPNFFDDHEVHLPENESSWVYYEHN